MTIDDVLSLSEAAERWGVSATTIKFSCLGQKGYPPRFHKGEYRKSGGIWLVSRQGMERLYGEEKEK